MGLEHFVKKHLSVNTAFYTDFFGIRVVQAAHHELRN